MAAVEIAARALAQLDADLIMRWERFINKGKEMLGASFVADAQSLLDLAKRGATHIPSEGPAPDHPSQARIERLRAALRKCREVIADDRDVMVSSYTNFSGPNVGTVDDAEVLAYIAAYDDALSAIDEALTDPHTLASAAGTPLDDHDGVNIELQCGGEKS